MELTDPAAREAVRMTDRMYARLVRRRPDFDLRREYFEGKQPLRFATDEWKKANAARYVDFSDNWSAPVVTAEAERIDHTGIKLDEQQFGDAARVLREQWLLNECEAQSSQGWVLTLTTSRTFVLVWADPITQQPEITWETGASAEVEYDWYNPRRRKAAIKSWVDEDNENVNYYDRDYLWKFFRPHPSKKDDHESQPEQARVIAGEGGWTPRETPGEPWPLPNPMREIPIVEIPNRPILGGDPLSEIAGTMPMQDAINLLWAYLFLGADYASMDARIITGTAPPKIPLLDKNGQPVGSRVVDMKELYEKRIAFFEGTNVQAQSWPRAELEQFLKTIERAVGHISAQTRTPPTYLITTVGMSNVSADGLKASEIGLVKKTIEFQRFVSPALREVYRLVALAMGDADLARAARLATIQWANPEIRSESQLADMLVKKKAIGYPLEYLMEIDGLDQPTIARVLAMVEQEVWDRQLAAVTERLTDAADGAGPEPEAGGDRVGDDSIDIQALAQAGA